jgi:dihydroorotase (multifunctional complex type)
MFDLGFEGGTVVQSHGSTRANVYVREGRIATVSIETHACSQRVDASGLLVMPGMVDAHVHLMDPSATDREDFLTGTAAAARAGVTTIIEHSHAGPVRSLTELSEKLVYLKSRSRVDYGLAAHAWPDMIHEIPALWESGVTFFKAFTCTTHGVPGFDAAHLFQLFTCIRAAGGICLVHCEDETITAETERELRNAGRRDPLVVVEWRSRVAELTSLSVAVLMARLSGARAVMAHVSSPDALHIVDRERKEGAPVVAESCPQYLSLLEEEIIAEGPFRKFTPPARARNDEELAMMWHALAQRQIDYIATDHAPATPAQKTEGSIWDVHFGLPGLDTTLPVLLDAASAGRITYERVVEAYAEAPARIYGLYPRKGYLGEGCDADVILVDPAARWTVRNEDILSKAGWSPFAGRTLTGLAVRTYLRGRLIAEESKVMGEPGLGAFLPGPGGRRAQEVSLT